jgi:hypothetical protein
MEWTDNREKNQQIQCEAQWLFHEEHLTHGATLSQRRKTTTHVSDIFDSNITLGDYPPKLDPIESWNYRFISERRWWTR